MEYIPETGHPPSGAAARAIPEETAEQKQIRKTESLPLSVQASQFLTSDIRAYGSMLSQIVTERDELNPLVDPDPAKDEVGEQRMRKAVARSRLKGAVKAVIAQAETDQPAGKMKRTGKGSVAIQGMIKSLLDLQIITTQPSIKQALQAKAFSEAARAGQRPGLAPRGNLQDDEYWLEALDKKHRMGDGLGKLKSVWQREGSPMNFFDWMDAKGTAALEAELRKVCLASSIPALMTGVKYLDQMTRKNACVNMADGELRLNGEPFDTTKYTTEFSGPGWAIYVLSPSPLYNFYVGNHIMGTEHHSSLLAGGKVAAAGELKVSNGKLEIITAKSGHYKPTLDMFLTVLGVLRLRGNIDLSQVKLPLYYAPPKEPTEAPIHPMKYAAVSTYEPITVPAPATIMVNALEFLTQPSSRPKDYLIYDAGGMFAPS
jgi:hypothetical protein